MGRDENLGSELEGRALTSKSIDESEVMNMGIDELELSVRSYNCLKRAGINTIGDLRQRSFDDLTRVRNMGRKSLNEILLKLNELGVSLRESEVAEEYTELNHPGRKRCEQLREMRIRVAKVNDIEFEPNECHHTEPCKGMCLMCDYEVAYLEKKLREKAERGEKTPLKGLLNVEKYLCDLSEDGEQIDVDIKAIKIEEVGFSNRTYNCLNRAGLKTLGDIIKNSSEKLMQIGYLGKKSCDEIVEKLAEYDLSLRDPMEEKMELVAKRLAEKKAKQERQNRIELELQRAFVNRELGDCAESLKHFEKAVELGYNEDYSMIGVLYIAGQYGVEQKIEKGIYWLTRFYTEYKAGKLKLKNHECLFTTCYGLGVATFMKIGKGDCEDDRTGAINKAQNFFRDAVDFAFEEMPENPSELTAKYLMFIGHGFNHGSIQLENYEDIIQVPTDYEYGYKALTKANLLGNVLAETLLAEMYEEGWYVEKNEIEASKLYLKAAFKGEKNAIEWSQNYFVDSLKWEKFTRLQAIKIDEIVSQPVAHIMASRLGIYTLEDYKSIKIEEIKDNGVYAVCVYALFRELKDYSGGYGQSIEDEIQNVLDVKSLAAELDAYGYPNMYGETIDSYVLKLESFYKKYSDHTLEIKSAFNDIAQVEYDLGICYAYGIGVEEDIEGCRKFLAKAIIHGKEKHHHIIMVCSKAFDSGTLHVLKTRERVSINTDYKYAYRGFKKIEAWGDDEAKYYLSKMFDIGKYVKRDAKYAEKLYKESIKNGMEESKE